MLKHKKFLISFLLIVFSFVSFADIFACDEPPSVSDQPLTVLDGLEPNESENKVTGATATIDAGNSDKTIVMVVITAVILLTF